MASSRRGRSGARPWGILAAAVALVLSGAGRAAAQGPSAIPFQVTVLQASDQPGPIDPRVERWNRLLSKKIRYGSLKLIESRQISVPLNGIGSLRLPTGTQFRFRPIDNGKSGVLVSVDMQGTAQGDFRIPRGKPLVLGGEPHGKGQLVVILEASP